MATATALELIEQQIVSRDERRVRDAIAAVHRAHFTKDAVAIAAQYTEDATIFNLAPPLEHRGIDIGEKQAWLDSWETPIEIVPRDSTSRSAATSLSPTASSKCVGLKKEPKVRYDSGCVRPWPSNASAAAGASFTNTHRSRSIWTAPSGLRSICSRKTDVMERAHANQEQFEDGAGPVSARCLPTCYPRAQERRIFRA